MKKTSLFAIALLFASTMNASAENNNGGFQNNNNQQIISVTEIAELKDGDYVMLQGNILEKTGDESYNFKDNSGTIVIEIDNDTWAGITVTPNDMVIIGGEIDKDMMEPTIIEVDTIQMAK